MGPYNPVAMLSQVDNRGERFNYAGNITATLRPVTGLKVVASLSSNNENYEASKYVSRESRYSILGNYDGSAEMSNYFTRPIRSKPMPITTGRTTSTISA